MKKFIAIEIDLPPGIGELELEFIQKLVEDMRIQPRAFTFGDQPSGNPIYRVDQVVTGKWEYV